MAVIGLSWLVGIVCLVGAVVAVWQESRHLFAASLILLFTFLTEQRYDGAMIAVCFAAGVITVDLLPMQLMKMPLNWTAFGACLVCEGRFLCINLWNKARRTGRCIADGLIGDLYRIVGMAVVCCIGHFIGFIPALSVVGISLLSCGNFAMNPRRSSWSAYSFGQLCWVIVVLCCCWRISSMMIWDALVTLTYAYVCDSATRSEQHPGSTLFRRLTAFESDVDESFEGRSYVPAAKSWIEIIRLRVWRWLLTTCFKRTDPTYAVDTMQQPIQKIGVEIDLRSKCMLAVRCGDGLRDQHMVCKLMSAKGGYELKFEVIDKVQSYIAISHAWWPPKATELVVEFKEWDIMWKKEDNMWDSLYRATRGSWFWIDVLCLPQKRKDKVKWNNEERQSWPLQREQCMNKLLRNMHKVYADTKCTCTLVLVKGEKCPSITLRACGKLLRAAALGKNSSLHGCEEVLSPRCLLSDPWFLRLWTSVELCMSNKLVVFTTEEHNCGILGCIGNQDHAEAAEQLVSNKELAPVLEFVQRTIMGNAGGLNVAIINLCHQWATWDNGLHTHALDASPFAPALQDPELSTRLLYTGRRTEEQRDYFICAALLLAGKDRNIDVPIDLGKDVDECTEWFNSARCPPEFCVVSKIPRGVYEGNGVSQPMYGTFVARNMIKPLDSRSWAEAVGTIVPKGATTVVLGSVQVAVSGFTVTSSADEPVEMQVNLHESSSREYAFTRYNINGSKTDLSFKENLVPAHLRFVYGFPQVCLADCTLYISDGQEFAAKCLMQKDAAGNSLGVMHSSTLSFRAFADPTSLEQQRITDIVYLVSEAGHIIASLLQFDVEILEILQS